MPSQREIAKHFNCAPSYVAKLVKRGLVTDSIQGAIKWREENTGWRAATDQKSIARQVGEDRNDNSSAMRITIPFSTGKELAFTGYDLILKLVNGLPKRAAAACNPDNPKLAFSVLDEECFWIHCRAYRAYALWHVPPEPE
jgi:hypothetical protein